MVDITVWYFEHRDANTWFEGQRFLASPSVCLTLSYNILPFLSLNVGNCFSGTVDLRWEFFFFYQVFNVIMNYNTRNSLYMSRAMHTVARVTGMTHGIVDGDCRSGRVLSDRWHRRWPRASTGAPCPCCPSSPLALFVDPCVSSKLRYYTITLSSIIVLSRGWPIWARVAYHSSRALMKTLKVMLRYTEED